jgi:hypothetical protein
MKGRAKRGTGGVDEAAMDLKDKPTDRLSKNNVSKEAEERKRGGRLDGFGPEHEATRMKRKRGGKMVEAEGEKAKMHAGRKPRKSGGSCESSPFTSARYGKEAPGRKVDGEME